MDDSGIRVYGAHWCRDCRRSKQFLGVIEDNLRDHDNLEVRYGSEVVRFDGSRGKLSPVTITGPTGGTELIHSAGLFVFIGLAPTTTFLDASGVKLNQRGFVVRGHDLVHSPRTAASPLARELAFLETSVPDVFTAGDVRTESTKQVVSAAGEGAVAALLIRDYLKRV